MKQIKNQNGQGLVEYLIIVALMGVATIGIVRLLSQNVNAQFANVIYSLQGKSGDKQARKESVSESDYDMSDLSNFMNGAAKRKKNK